MTPIAMAPDATLAVHRPDVLTKELQLLRTPGTGERRFLLSSNWLNAFGFMPDTRIERQVAVPGQGLTITSDPAGATKVYQRRYTRRASNPFETQLDIKAQSLLDAAFPGYIERVHVTFEAGRLQCRPIAERSASIRFGHRRTAEPLSAFVALSSGIDAACLARVGFTPKNLLEWRPIEKRDRSDAGVRDFTESGILTACANTAFTRVFNEDLRTVDMRRLETMLAGDVPVSLMHLSLTCDDYSNLKAQSLKDRHVVDLDTTRDLTYDALRLIESAAPSVVMIENVPGYLTSPEGELLSIKLRRWGYHVHQTVADARDFGGPTSRKRAYLVASVFPGFEFPTPPMGERPAGWVWDACVADDLANCRDVSANVSVRLGFETGRIRLLTPESTSAPTVTKSQSRMTKDSLYLRLPDGRVLFPTEKILQRLNGIPADFTFAATSGELAQEQIGQSIDWSLHEAIAVTVREHLLQHWEAGSRAIPAR